MTWNRGIHELLGYDRDEVVGKSGDMVFNKKDRAAGTFKGELARARRSGESITIRTNVRKDGSEFEVHDTVSALFDTAGFLIGFAKVARAMDEPQDLAVADQGGIELAKALAIIAVEVEHRRRLEAQLLTAIEQERERLGRDLHDDLSQRLAGIGLMLDMSLKRLGAGTPVRTQLVAIGQLLAEAIGVARNLSRGLHPVTLSTQGLPAALQELGTRVPGNVEFSWPHSKRLDLKTSDALHLYRIAEEAVGNAIRHSGSKKIKISLKGGSPGSGVLTISDNGKGFRQETRSNGMGLQNMKYRAGVINGSIKITATPGEGTQVECTFPIRRRLTKAQPAPKPAVRRAKARR